MPRLAVAAAWIVLACTGQARRSVPPKLPQGPEMPKPTASSGGADACQVKELRKSAIQGLRRISPDGTRFLVNKEDEAGIAQVYVGTSRGSGLTCITCVHRPGGPKAERFKMQPHWHPSGQWIVLAAERDEYSPPPILRWSKDYVEGQLQNGIWMDMYAVSPDGSKWHELVDFPGVNGEPGGYTGPVFTPDGERAVWSQIVSGNVVRYRPFGRWELIMADFDVKDGVPRWSNLRDITPAGMHWNEPGGFGPDNVSLLFSGSVEKNARGMDQYILNIDTGELKNLTRTPSVWDEHGALSPDGKKIIFMSAHPYRADPRSSTVLSIRTEFMLMNRDGSGLIQLTHFREPGYPEYSRRGGIAANAVWSPDGRSANLLRYFFPNLEYWDVVFEGPCGNGAADR